MLYFARWKIFLVVAISVLGILLALPNTLSTNALNSLPSWVPKQQINLGLDLQGGSYMLLSMETKALLEDRLESLRGDLRRQFRENKIGYTGLRATKSHVRVKIRKPDDFDKALTLVKAMRQPLQSTVLGGSSGFDFDISNERSTGVLIITPTELAISQRLKSAMDASIETVGRRINNLGTTEPIIQRQGLNRIIVQVPGLDDPQQLKDLLGATAKLEFRMVDQTMSAQQALSSRPPVGSEVLPSQDPNDGFGPYLIKKRVVVSGEELVDSQASFDGQSNEPVVTFRFNSAGATRFAKITRDNVGRPFAIVLDNKVISAPVIQTAITGGSGQISGNFSVADTVNLSILLRSGALPAPLVIIEERTVGPSLGADSIASGKTASIIGIVVVVAFIIASYGLFGIFANIALAVNIALIIGLLSLLQATLTLPGIAGIVLTIGMAVDANVLIFERIREEIRVGKTPIAAIDVGYSRALSTILDANITTFIAAFILFSLGSGPVRGFSVTLSIGIITSVFTAFTLTRLLIAFWIRQKRPKTIPI
jgi:protein-export membrane protein SecD